MSRLEIIHLRSSAGCQLETLRRRISESIQSAGEVTTAVTVFCRDGLETDMAVHIRTQNPANPKRPSTLGHHLASALRLFGLVEHTVWREMQ